MTYRTISPTFWTDSKVDDEFTPEDKYFYLYLLTNPHTNICGCYEVGNKQIERETGYNIDTIQRLLHRFEFVHEVIKYSPNTKEILILNWGKYNWSHSSKLVKGVEKVASYIKCDEFKQIVIETVRSYVTDTDTESDTDTDVSIGYRYPINTKRKSGFHNAQERNNNYAALQSQLLARG